MRKPSKPTNTLPESFGGYKENFSQDKINYGYQPDIPDILGGANLNYLLDTCGDNNRYFNAICDFIRDIPVAKTITVNTNGELVYQDWLGGRNFGELVYSSIPLSDSSLKLLDGSLIQGTGIYSNFVEYMASIIDDYPTIFTTESNWQTTVNKYGVCGKYVYNATDNTVRIPKVTGIIEGTVDVNALGNIVAAGLPTLTTATSGNHTHSGTTGKGSAHSHTRGSMNIKGTLLNAYDDMTTGQSGAFYKGNIVADNGVGYNADHHGTSVATHFVASRNWTGSTSSESAHTHGFSIGSSGSHNHTINWGTTTNTIQPQTVKMFVYVVVANGITKTDIELDIDDIVTDLNYKADIDLSNATNNISSGAKEFFTGLSFPSDRYTDLTLGTTGTEYTAPENGWFTLEKITGVSNGYITMVNQSNGLCTTIAKPGTTDALQIYVPIAKGQSIKLWYNATGATNKFRFIYAQGAES